MKEEKKSTDFGLTPRQLEIGIHDDPKIIKRYIAKIGKLCKKRHRKQINGLLSEYRAELFTLYKEFFQEDKKLGEWIDGGRTRGKEECSG